jgi:aryl-alcohol dehydrogenase-like predicted oxidoreductase
MFGEETSSATARRIVAMARDAGINFIDTADMYVLGESEREVGRLIKKDRDQWVLASKVGHRGGPLPHHQGLSRKWMMRAIDASLERLQTDYLDIWYLHTVDYGTPLEESIGAIGDVIRAGKARYWGFSNFPGWMIGEIMRVADKLGVPRPVIDQPYYNALNRMIEYDHLPAAEYFGYGVAPYAPLSRGLLTGKYLPHEPPPKGSRAARGNERILSNDYRVESMKVAQVIKEHAQARGMTPITFAILWLLNNRMITSIIAGPRTVAHWQGYLDALDYTFTAEDEVLLESLVPAGHSSTHGYIHPTYPPLGRKPLTG